jgi:hypothetical protein
MDAEVAELRRDEALIIPADLDYARLQLSTEVGVTVYECLFGSLLP